jgi:amino acid transporter
MHDVENTAPARANGLSRGALNTSELAFMVIAAAAPMAVVVALMPMAFAFGNGRGVPGTYACAVIAMLLFATGYVRIIPFVRNAGAFYAYISASFGRTFGLGAAYVAAISYFSVCCSTLGALAFFSGDLFARISGRSTPWELWAGLSIGLVSYFAYRRITLAAAILSCALIAEMVLLGLLDIAIVRERGFALVNLRSFSLPVIFAPGIGIAAIYAFNGLIGIEGTAIYQEEAKDRDRTVPRATYLSILMIGCFYVLTGWCIVIGVGESSDVARIARSDPGHFILGQIAHYMGPWAGDALSVLVVTSAFAAVLALFNNSARYVFALARDGVLPRPLARTHAHYHSPHVASVALTVLMIALFTVASLAGLDPLTTIATALGGVGSVGLMALLAVTSLGIPVFFARRGSWGFSYTFAPALGGCVIVAATLLAVQNYPAITGVTSPLINDLPIGLVLIVAAGIVQALWLSKRRVDVFERIGSNRVD